MKRPTLTYSPPQILALGYLSVITAGAGLLRLPAASDGSVSWLDAFFTATSATTVTGLYVVDTGSTFTRFGEIVLMLLMQIGGLGLMTFAVLGAIMLGRRLGLRQRLLFGEAMIATPLGGVVTLAKTLAIFAVAVELLGMLVLATVWVPELGLGEGLYTSAFHAVSAFNNAGFSLFTDNLAGYVGSPVVNIAITALLITGGIGFTVIEDLRHSRRWRELALHTKLMLTGTLAINVLAFGVILLFEYGNAATLGNLGWGEKLWASWFQGVAPRTAGFNTIDTGAMTETSLLFTMLLMFIGAGSASTGSGIKLTTFIVILLAVITFVRGRAEPTAFGRQIPIATVV
ncbi:MAG: potassium transporter TrkG, partial [Gaiellales bacterium]